MSSKQITLRSIRPASAILVCCLFASAAAYGQETSADILGTVSDPSGAIIPGAKVTLTNVATQVKQDSTTNQSGDYLFTLLKPGTYSLTIVAKGFKTEVVPSISLAAGDRNRENAALATGGVDETVTVTADAPLLQRESSSLTSVVTDQEVQDLPLNGRNVVNLVQIQPGVNAGSANAISSGNRPDDRRLSSTVSANGQSDYYNNNLVDGIDNNEREQGVIGIRPSIDAIAEVKVDTNSFTAEVGRSGGAVVNVLTKSGANAFHGSLYEYFRNDIFDARDFFAKTGVVDKPEYRQNQFGGSIGGPIFKDKTFFFADVEDDRVIQGQSSGLLTVPTGYEDQHPGDFTDIGGPFLPTALISPTGLDYFKLFPTPNIPGAITQNFESVTNKTQYTLTADGRIDHHFGNGDQIYGRYSYNNINSYLPGPLPAVTEAGFTINPGGAILSFDGPSQQKAHGFILDYVHPFTQNTLLELKAGYTRLDFQTSNLNEGKNISDAFGVTNGNYPGAPGTSGLTPLDFLTGGYADIGDSPFLPIDNTNNIFQYQGSLTYSHGKHTFKAGAQVIRRQLNYLQNSYGLGLLLYLGLTGNPIEDLLAGASLGYERGNTLFGQGFRMWEPSGYLQDDWRVTPNLTFNLGVRYDIFTPIVEAHNHYANFDYPELTLVTAAESPHVGINTAYKNVAPRVGFSDSIGTHTVVRGGYGISFYPTQASLGIQLANPPTNYQSICIGCIGAPLPAPVAPSTTNLSGSLSYAPSNLNTSYLETFNLAVQQEIKGNVITVAYVGELGRHQLFEPTVNEPAPNGPYAAGASTAPPPLLTAATLPNVSTIQGFLPIASSSYNAVQLIFARRLTRGLTVNSNYTLAHSLTNGIGGTGGTGAGQGLIASDPNYDYGNSGNDVRSRVATSVTYDLPFGKADHGAKAVITKGWSANFIDYWQTGLPFSVVNSFNPQINLPDVTTDRPDVAPGASLTVGHPTLNHFFNTAAFVPQALGTAGDEHFNQLYGPHQRRADLSLFKAVNLPREAKLQFRAECYNISNTPNYSVFSNNYTIAGDNKDGTPSSATGFGELTQTTPNTNPRQFQFALKILY